MPRDRTVGWLLTRAFAVLAGIVVCSGTIELAVVLVQNHTNTQLSERVEPLRLANAQVRTVLSDAERAVTGYTTTGDPDQAAAYAFAVSRYPLARQDLIGLGRDDGYRDTVGDEITAADGWLAAANRQRDSGTVADGAARFAAFADINQRFDLTLAARVATLHRRARALNWISVVVLALLTAVAGAAAAVTAARTGRRITRPLSRVGEVLDRRRSGERMIRVGPIDGPIEINAVARAVDALADQAELLRQNEQIISRQRHEVRQLGYRIRARLSVAEALGEAVRGLAGTMDADHVLIRMAESGTGGAGLLGTGPPGTGLASTGDSHVGGPLESLSRCGTDWLRAGDVWITGQPIVDGDGHTHQEPPEQERTAGNSLGGGPLLTVAVGDTEPCLGAVTLIREPGRPPFNQVEVRLTEVVAYDLARGVQHGRLFEREQQLVARLQALDTAKTDFMSTVSHELRTPLTSISGYLELLLDAEPGELSDAQLRMLEVIGRNTRRLRDLIEDILTLSKIESGDFRSEQGLVDLSEIIERAVAAVSPAAAKGQVGLHLDVRGPLPLTGDGVQLDRVLANLLTNAVKFTPAEGTVTVRAERTGETALLSVADTGMGIPADEQPALFARFFRATNAIHHAIPGTGLGLAIVRTIVNNHDGTIAVTSTENVGTEVTVRLPIK